MSEEKKTTTKKIVDTVVVSSLTSLIASIVGGVAFYVYSQATTATEDIREIKLQLKTIREESVEEFAALKAERKTDGERFDEISRFLQNNMGEFVLPKKPTYEDVKEQKDELEDKFNQVQQRTPPF